MFKPNFDKGLILKQHMLEALRDYPAAFVHTLFLEMGDGILTGLKTAVCEDGEHFRVSPGLVKLDGEVCFVTEETRGELRGGRNYVYLEKLPPVPAEDRSGSECELRVVQRGEEQAGSPVRMELFRYSRNAEMREYGRIQEIDQDMSNRIDRSRARKSVAGGSTLCDEFYTLFARFLLGCPQADAQDIGFAYQCLNGVRTLETVRAYFRTENTANDELIQCMKEKARELERRASSRPDAAPEPKPETRTICVY